MKLCSTTQVKASTSETLGGRMMWTGPDKRERKRRREQVDRERQRVKNRMGKRAPVKSKVVQSTLQENKR